MLPLKEMGGCTSGVIHTGISSYYFVTLLMQFTVFYDLDFVLSDKMS